MRNPLVITTARDARLNYMAFNHDAGRKTATLIEREAWGSELIRARKHPFNSHKEFPFGVIHGLLEISRQIMAALSYFAETDAAAGATATDDEGRLYVCSEDGSWTTDLADNADFGGGITAATLPNGARLIVRRPVSQKIGEPKLILEMDNFENQAKAAYCHANPQNSFVID